MARSGDAMSRSRRARGGSWGKRRTARPIEPKMEGAHDRGCRDSQAAENLRHEARPVDGEVGREAHARVCEGASRGVEIGHDGQGRVLARPREIGAHVRDRMHLLEPAGDCNLSSTECCQARLRGGDLAHMQRAAAGNRLQPYLLPRPPSDDPVRPGAEHWLALRVRARDEEIGENLRHVGERRLALDGQQVGCRCGKPSTLEVAPVRPRHAEHVTRDQNVVEEAAHVARPTEPAVVEARVRPEPELPSATVRP